MTHNEIMYYHEGPLMLKPVCAVYDRKIQMFDSPFTVRHVGEAIREFELVQKNTETKFGKNPEDFELYKIGDYDERSAAITAIKPEQLL